MTQDINNLGTFKSVKEVWERYPEGGIEGDYLMIGTTKYRWNKYDCIWENAATVTESAARKTEAFEGDVTVSNNLTVGGVLRAHSVKQPNCGLFKSYAELVKAYPNPEVGMWACVGDSTPAPIYRCESAGRWVATGATGGVDNLDLSELETKIAELRSDYNEHVETNTDVLDEMSSRLASLRDEFYTLVGGNTSEAIESFNEIIAFLEGVTDQETFAGKLVELENLVRGFEGKIGADWGVAPLDGAGKVPAENMPEDVYDVVMLRAVVQSLNDQPNPMGGGKFYDAATNELYVSRTVTSGITIRFVWEIDTEEALSTRRIYVDTRDNIPYRWDGSAMIAIAAKNAPASIYNATTEHPVSGYYSLLDDANEALSVLHAAWKDNKAVSGLIVSFELGAGIWKTYQYVGKTVTEQNWFDTDNWKDFGSLAAGSETYIIVDQLVGNPAVGDYYTLGTAVQGLLQHQKDTGVNYAKKGLIISYKTGENTMETKQFQGEVSDFGIVALWKDFGGGGSKVETKDEPEAEGKDALSTGGAYKSIPTSIAIDTETEGTVKMHLANAEGDMVGEEVQFVVGTGSGGAGTTIAMNFKENPMYGKAGGEFVVKAAIMSITKAGSQEMSNSITQVEVKDRTTKKILATFMPKQPSSATLDDYSFSFDLSNLFAQAGQSNLQLVVTDDGGNTATKNLSVVAVDVTCVSVQTLNYTKDTSLEVGGMAKNIPMYSFPNNASDKGIKVTVEMRKAYEWVTIQETVVNDNYSHSVKIDPGDLAHGAYPLRIQGEDVASGVKGNILHTAVMVIQQNAAMADYNTPIVVARWSAESEKNPKKLFANVGFDIAAYQRNNSRPEVDVFIGKRGDEADMAEKLTTKVLGRDSYQTITKRLLGYEEGDELIMRASATSDDGFAVVTNPDECVFVIEGTLLPISETEGAIYKLDMSGKSNADTDKSIVADKSGGGKVTVEVEGSNYSTNGFVKSSYGTPEYGTKDDWGRMALRVAEDVTAVCDDMPFASGAIETNGLALSFTVMVKNVADREAHIMECMGDKMGFVLTGEKLVFAVNGDLDDATTTATVPYVTGKDTRFDIVIEPSQIAPYGGIGMVKIFRNGDMAGAVAYKAGDLPTTNAQIRMDGHDADLYFYGMTRWNSYYNFIQACNNYLIGLTDTTAMIAEYEKENVMASQFAEGKTSDRPSMQKCLDAGIMVCVITKNPDTDATLAQSYPDYLEGLDGDKKTKIVVDWYLYFPDRPWQDCHIIHVEETNQGTTSSWRPIKNKKAKHKTCQRIVLLHTREEISQMFNGDAEILAKYDKCAEMAEQKKLQIVDGGNFTNINTIKVDYSDSCGAHNTAMMELMNDTQIALGEKYMTPAQVSNEGEYEIHTSIDGVTCALFRTDGTMNANDACDPTKAYFHAKANFNADKGDAKFFGFEGVKGYNKNCLNYGDFVELVAAPDQELSEFRAEVLANAAAQLVSGKIYVLSEYCGDKHVVLEDNGDDVWRETTGHMEYNKATKKWTVTGRVVNPVECYEYLKYDALNWGQGVNTVADMMVIDEATGAPLWMSYYESRYPDDDDLNALYESGRKVPYNLYKWLVFNQECNHNLTDDRQHNAQFFNGAGAKTTITINGNEVAATSENRMKKWREELRHIANPYSLYCYTVASDYKASVDQRSKNMMIAFYLDTTGEVRAYFNHWYDGDCVDGSDNDCGLTIPWDMDATTSHLYQGWDGVMFNQSYRAEKLKRMNADGTVADTGGVWLDESHTESVTLHDVADAMRKVEKDGTKVFSAEGCYKYWVTKRLAKWAKVISSYDGERKYVQASTAASNYFYALHGLRLEDLPDYQKKRFKMCDGQYEVGDLYTNPFKMRAMGEIEVRITAAQDGFFGLGEDRADVCADKCQLKAGESYTLRAKAAQESGKMIYIFGADKLAMLDISRCSPKNEGFDIQYCTLLKKLVVGGFGYSPAYTTGILTSLDLPSMPFLEEIDIQYTKILNLRATNCPRLKTVKAGGSLLKTFVPSEACPLETVELPSTMTDLVFVNLPKLTYPNGGLTVENMRNVANVRVAGCPGIDALRLLEDVMATETRVARIDIPNVDVTKNATLLERLKAMGTKGYGANDTDNECRGLSGKWMLNEFMEDEKIAELQSYFPELRIKNVQYTLVSFDDTVEDVANISNEDNKTGYKYAKDYAPSGHVSNILSRRHTVMGKYQGEKRMKVCLLDDNDRRLYHDGTPANLKGDRDATKQDEGDVYVYEPRYWYKGVNDYLNDMKYQAFSSVAEMPEDAGSKSVKVKLSELVKQDGKALKNMAVGTAVEEGVMTYTGYTLYRIDVGDAVMMRWPAVASGTYGAAFVDKDGRFMSFVKATTTGFESGDYLYTRVPKGAKALWFTAPTEIDTNLYADWCVRCFSEEVVAVEPDWVEHTECLTGAYEANYQNDVMRSISGVNATNNYQVQQYWAFAEGRGKGFQCVDYEMSKDVANLFYAKYGTRDSQRQCGYGSNSTGSTCGRTDLLGMRDTINPANQTSQGFYYPEGSTALTAIAAVNVMGYENWQGDSLEWMSRVGIANGNVVTDNLGKNRVTKKGVWQIVTYDDTVREVLCVRQGDRYIIKVRNGRYCDVISSAVGGTSSTFYADYQWYSDSAARVVGRSVSNASASGGVACAHAHFDSSFAPTNCGSRLAFRGKIEFVESVEEFKALNMVA